MVAASEMPYYRCYQCVASPKPLGVFACSSAGCVRYRSLHQSVKHGKASSRLVPITGLDLSKFGTSLITLALHFDRLRLGKAKIVQAHFCNCARLALSLNKIGCGSEEKIK